VLKVTVCHTAGHYGEEYDDCNMGIFTRWFRLKKSKNNCNNNMTGSHSGTTHQIKKGEECTA